MLMTTLQAGSSREFSREPEPTGSGSESSERELLLLVGLSLVLMWATIFFLHQTPALALSYGDNGAYLDVAKAILQWDFHHLQLQHFMGYSYFIAALSFVFRIPPGLALWLIAVGCSLLSVWLTSRLFGTTVAQYFAFTNFSWLQLSWLGGSEPLAVALALGSLLAFRRNRVVLAALLGSLAVTVRPLMIFVLVGIGLVLLCRKRFGAFVSALAVGLGIGFLYMWPLARYFGDPLFTVHSYTTQDYGGGGIAGPHGRLFGWPFHGIVAGTITYSAPWTSLVLSFSWIALVLLGVGMMFRSEFRKYARNYPHEVVFCGLYLLAVFSYDYLLWARSNFIRFSIPALPFVFLALRPFLPMDRRVTWGLCVVTAILAAVSAIGLPSVVRVIH